MGDWILFRGRRRFVVLVRPGGIVLERVRPGRRGDGCAFYSVGQAEKVATRVVKESTPHARSRAKRLLEARCMPWTSIVWDGDSPTYAHDVSWARSSR